MWMIWLPWAISKAETEKSLHFSQVSPKNCISLVLLRFHIRDLFTSVDSMQLVRHGKRNNMILIIIPLWFFFANEKSRLNSFTNVFVPIFIHSVEWSFVFISTSPLISPKTRVYLWDWISDGTESFYLKWFTDDGWSQQTSISIRAKKIRTLSGRTGFRRGFPGSNVYVNV